MPQVLNISNPWSSMGSSIGQALGQGLEEYAQHKLQVKQQGRVAKALEDLGIPAAKARALSQIGDVNQQNLLKNHFGSLTGSGSNSSIEQLLGSNFQSSPQQQAPQYNQPNQAAYQTAQQMPSISQAPVPQQVQQQLPQQLMNVSPNQVAQVKRYLETPEAQKKYQPEQIEAVHKALDRLHPEQKQQQGSPSVSPIVANQLAQQAAEQQPVNKGGGRNTIQPNAAPVGTQPLQLAEGITPEKVEQIKRLHDFVQPKTPKEKLDFAKKVEQILSGETKVSEAQQKRINSANAPYLKDLEKSYANAIEVTNIAKQMKDLLATGKVASGVAGKFTPIYLQNTETQLFDKLSNQLAQMLSGTQGVPTGFKIKFALTQKPNIEQNTQTQKALVDRIITEAQKPITKYKIKDELIAQNNYEQPANIGTRINELFEKNMAPRETQITEETQSVEPEASGNQGESPLGTLARGGVRIGAQAIGLLGGQLGNIPGAALGIGNYLTGGTIPTYEQIQEMSPIPLPPTSQQITEKISDLTGGYTKPQGQIEKGLSDFIDVAGSFFLPGKAIGPFVNNLSKIISPSTAKVAGKIFLPFSGKPVSALKAAGVAGAGLGASKVTEFLGGGPIAQATAQLGAMTLASTAGGRKVLDDVMTKSYQKAEDFVKPKTIKTPNGLEKNIYSPQTFVNVENAEKNLKKLSESVLRGNNPNKQIALDLIEGTRDAIKNMTAGGKDAPVAELLELKRNSNEWFKLASRPIVPGEKHLPRGVRKYVHEILDDIAEPIKEFGKSHPEFNKDFLVAEDIFKGFNDLSEATQFLKDNVTLKNGLKSDLAKLGLFAGASYFSIPTGIGLVAGAKGIREFALLKNLLGKSNTAKIYYIQALKAAAENNIPAFTKHAAQFDREAIKYEKRK